MFLKLKPKFYNILKEKMNQKRFTIIRGYYDEESKKLKPVILPFDDCLMINDEIYTNKRNRYKLREDHDKLFLFKEEFLEEDLKIIYGRKNISVPEFDYQVILDIIDKEEGVR